MKVEITDKFHDNDSIALAYKKADSPNGFMLIWCTIAKRMLQTGTHMTRAPKINAVSKIIEVGNLVESASFKAMEEVGMVVVTESDAPVTLGEDKYEEWIAAYPYRDVNGKKVKVRGKSKLRFHNQIRSEETFSQLMNATYNYAGMCNSFPKDPERFLLKDFWKEYITVESVRPQAIDSASLEQMMQ